MLPAYAASSAKAAEREVFKLIEHAPNSQDYVCLHSLGMARHERKEYAEIDFVCVGPPGVFCLEVKGGEVYRQDGLWHIGWPGKTYESVEGPFKQSQGARWALIDYLNAQFKTNVRKQCIIGWGVLFPDVIFTETDPEWDGEVIYDQRHKADSFTLYIERLAIYFRNRHDEISMSNAPRLSTSRISEIVSCLRSDFEVVQSVRGLQLESERQLVSLSNDQFRVLDFALDDANRRLICLGGAGSGKTLLALESARRLSDSGKNVLLLCYNHNLTRFLQGELRECNSKIMISTVHRFLAETIRRGGFGRELANATATLSADELFSLAYPKLFERAALALIEEDDFPLFDVLIVDEAQDILETGIMNCLDMALNDGFARGRWVIFLDDGLQARLYGRLNEQVLSHLRSLGAFTIALKENFRNPESIVDEMCAVTGANKPVCRRQLPSKVEFITFATEREQGKLLRALLVKLIGDQIAPASITILSARRREHCCVTRFPPDMGKPIVFLDSDNVSPTTGSILAATVAGFKGLENDFIVLTDLPRLADLSELDKSVLYVGMTRARTKLFLLLESAVAVGVATSISQQEG